MLPVNQIVNWGTSCSLYPDFLEGQYKGSSFTGKLFTEGIMDMSTAHTGLTNGNPEPKTE